MKKMMEQHRKFMKNNKGFSLVELIIVIAIMAVLVAVLAPQYTKYVEKSRVSTDISAADSILGACKTIAIDPETYDAASGGFEATWTGSSGEISVTVGGTENTDLTKALQALVGTTIKANSKAVKTGTITVTYDADAGTFVVAGTGDTIRDITSSFTATPTSTPTTTT